MSAICILIAALDRDFIPHQAHTAGPLFVPFRVVCVLSSSDTCTSLFHLADSFHVPEHAIMLALPWSRKAPIQHSSHSISTFSRFNLFVLR